jgi:iron complex outermembrane receptor protein
MKKTILTLSLVTTCLLAESLTLEPLKITSTAIEQDELKSTDAIEVYTQEDIEKAHVQNVYEFLNQQTSVISMPTYGNPFAQKLDMHGYGIGDGYQNIVVTLNGRKINNIDMVAPLLSSISPASISRIEIIKSSGIVMGGDGANAGVINIQTKKNNDKELSFYGGTYNTIDGSFYIGHSGDKLSVSASAEAQKNGGIRHLNASGDKDENRLATGNFDLAYTPTEDLELRLNAAFARTEVNYAGSLSKEEYDNDPTQEGSSYTTQKYDTDVIGAGVSYFISDNLSITADASRQKKKSDSTNVSSYGPYSWIADYLYDSFHVSFDYESDIVDISAGIDGFNGERNSHATLYGAKNTTTKDNLAGFLMSQWKFGPSTFKAGYRFEKVNYKFSDASHSSSDDNTLHGVELGYNMTLDSEKSIFLNYAHSYQSPDIDRFFSYGIFNKFIEPMEANSFTLGFNYIKSTNKLKISAYYVDLKNEIYYYKDSVNSYPDPSLSVNTNIDASHKLGLDIYDRWLINKNFELLANYNYVQAIIDDEKGRNNEDYSGNTLPGVSDHNVKLTLSYLPNERTRVAFTQVYRSEAYAANDFENNFSQKQDAYMSSDISVSYNGDNYEAFAKINNLFNQSNGLWIRDDAIYPVNFTTTAIAGLKLKF